VDANGGVLAIACDARRPPSNELLAVCVAIAASGVSMAGAMDERSSIKSGWPKGLEGKARTLGRLNARFVERTRFVDLALRSVEDGLIIAGPDGRITFVNRSAAAILE